MRHQAPIDKALDFPLGALQAEFADWSLKPGALSTALP